jgi:tRNA (adenine37-N6)-methyltransferase
MENIYCQPVGIIHTPFKTPVDMPLQAIAGKGVAGSIEIFPEYQEGLKDLDGFSHLILIYYMHLAGSPSLTVLPFLDSEPRGVFSTRHPRHPNMLGLSIVRLVSVEGCTLQIEDLDMIDGSPLLDIKPYVPTFDIRENVSIGWLAKNVEQVHTVKADHRER